MNVKCKITAVFLSLILLLPAFIVKADEEDAMKPSKPVPYAYWDMTGPGASKKMWHDDSVVKENVDDGVKLSSEKPLGFDTVFGTNPFNLKFEKHNDYTVMVKFKILNNSIDNMQFVVNASKNKKEAGVYAYRFDTSDYRCLYSYSYNPKIGEYREWLGDFQKINSRDEGYVIAAFHLYIDSDLEDAYIKLQAGDKQKDKPFEIILNSVSIFKGYAELKNDSSVFTDSPVFYEKNIDTSKAVQPSEPMLIKAVDFRDEKTAKKFWSDSELNITIKNGGYRAYKKIGSDFATLIGTSTAVLALDSDSDYTIMMRYKTNQSVPVFQFVVNCSFDYEEKSLYTMRYSNSDFSRLMTYGYNYKTNRFTSELADFQAIDDDGYTTVSFHFYVPDGHEGTYFKFQTSEGQAPKEIDFQLDKISVFKGYADLSKASDIDGKNPTMHIPEVPPGRRSHLEGVSIVINDKKNTSLAEGDKKAASSAKYIIDGIWCVVAGIVLAVAGAALFTVLLIRAKKPSRKRSRDTRD